MDGLEDLGGLSEAGELSQGSEQIGQGGRVLVLPVNGKSRKITQILSNETSLKILELLRKESMFEPVLQTSINLLQKYIGVIGAAFFASFFKKSLTTNLF